MIQAKVSSRPAKILHFDIENRPLAYSGGDYTTGEITAIAAGWSDKKKVRVWLLGYECDHCGERPKGTVDMSTMLSEFVDLYDKADIVTGHYIRAHDLPMINGALLESHLPPLTEKWTSDTYLDLVKRKYLSASQESLSDMYGLPNAKHHMSIPQWRQANRLTAAGVTLARKRAVSDIVQHRDLRTRLIEADALKENKIWRP